MIIQRKDGMLIDDKTGAKYTIGTERDGSDVVKFVVPSSGYERILLFGENSDDCVAFIGALAVEKDAVRWSASKRAFVPVAGGDDG